MDEAPPEIIELTGSPEQIEQRIESVPDTPAVFAIWAREGTPYLGRTNVLRRRLRRLLTPRSGTSRMLNLRVLAARVEFWLTGSRLESAVLNYELARRHFPGLYRKIVKLPALAYLKVLLANRFPRCQITSKTSSGSAMYFGPFRTRVLAEQFQEQFLNLFQLRRCTEDLSPLPSHPGCIYGEMGKCLRPCQQVVGEEEYRSEVERVTAFLASGGQSMLQRIAGIRDRLSEQLDFEQAAYQHSRYEKVQAVLALRDDLASDVRRIHGVCVTPSAVDNAVELWFVVEGCFHSRSRFEVGASSSAMVPLDARLRQVLAALAPSKYLPRQRDENLALLSRWYHASDRDGEWLPFEDLGQIPYRKLVNAIHRVSARGRSY
ncbi:MAG: hypothetical protein LC130_18040 [Bryobacterales bacterium]|nr:hypothetical protein [Bryobacterales bacterium]